MFSFQLCPRTPLLADLGALAAYDLNKLPDARKSGEDIIREIQQELMMRVSSAETAVVPEKDAQCLMVGVSCTILYTHIFLKFSAYHARHMAYGDINHIFFIDLFSGLRDHGSCILHEGGIEQDRRRVHGHNEVGHGWNGSWKILGCYGGGFWL